MAGTQIPGVTRRTAAALSLAMLRAVARAEPGCLPDAGRRAFGIDSAMCHAIDKSQGAIVGPSLFGVFGRPVGKLPGLTYSRAPAASTGKWDVRELDLFLKAPAVERPGTSMPFAGVGNDTQRASTICYQRGMR